MPYPKMKPCPDCYGSDGLAVYTYDNGWRHVECVECNYLGPGCSSVLSAIRSHNEERDSRAESHRAALVAKAEGK